MKIYHYPSSAAEEKMKAIIGREIDFRKSDVETVTRILDEVKQNGDDALIQYNRKFDAPDMSLSSLQVSVEEMENARKQVDRPFVRALNRAASQIESFHRQQLPCPDYGPAPWQQSGADRC